MSRSVVARCLLTCMVFGAALSPSIVETQPESTSADARLRALYTEEWNWRRKEMARGGDQPGEAGASDHFPKVDAASEQARLEYWTRTLKTLDSIPFDELSAGGESQRANLPHLDPRARQRRDLPHLRGAVQQRHLLLDRVHATPGFCNCRSVSRISWAAS